MSYKIISKFIKDISFEIPNTQTFIMIEKEILNYNLNCDIKSKPYKENIIEVNTILKLSPNQNVKHKMLTEINLASLVSIEKNFEDKKELEKIILIKIPTEVYPTLYETFIYLFKQAGIKDISFEIPSAQAFVMLEKEILNYNLKFDIKSKPFKENIIEVNTVLRLSPNQDVKHKILTEINLATLVSLEKSFKDKNELEKIILVKIPTEIYPTLYETFIYLFKQAGIKDIKIEKDVNFERHITELAKIRDEARVKGAWSAATNAEVARGKAAGLYVDQKLILSGNLDQLSEKELESRMKQILDDHKVLIDGVAIDVTSQENNLNKSQPT